MFMFSVPQLTVQTQQQSQQGMGLASPHQLLFTQPAAPQLQLSPGGQLLQLSTGVAPTAHTAAVQLVHRATNSQSTSSTVAATNSKPLTVVTSQLVPQTVSAPAAQPSHAAAAASPGAELPQMQRAPGLFLRSEPSSVSVSFQTECHQIPQHQAQKSPTKQRVRGQKGGVKKVKKSPSKPGVNSTIAKILESAKREMEKKSKPATEVQQ